MHIRLFSILIVDLILFLNNDINRTPDSFRTLVELSQSRIKVFSNLFKVGKNEQTQTDILIPNWPDYYYIVLAEVCPGLTESVSLMSPELNKRMRGKSARPSLHCL